MREWDKNEIIRLVTTIFCLLGSLLTVIGIFLPIELYPNDSSIPSLNLLKGRFTYIGNYYEYGAAIGYVILAITFVVLIITIITLLNLLIQKMNLYNSTTGLFFTLGFYVFLPIFVPGHFYSIFSYLTQVLTQTASDVAFSSLMDPGSEIDAGGGFYLLTIGLIILLVCFILTAILFFIDRAKKKERVSYEESKAMEAKDLFRVVVCGVAILAAIMLLLGLALPLEKEIYRPGTTIPDSSPSNTFGSFLVPLEWYNNGSGYLSKGYLDQSIFFYFLLVIGIVASAIVSIIGTIKRKHYRSLNAVLFFTIILVVFPFVSIYPSGLTLLVIQSPILEFVYTITELFYWAKRDEILYVDLVSDSRTIVSFGGFSLLLGSIFILATLLLSAIAVMPVRVKDTTVKSKKHIGEKNPYPIIQKEEEPEIDLDKALDFDNFDD